MQKIIIIKVFLLSVVLSLTACEEYGRKVINIVPGIEKDGRDKYAASEKVARPATRPPMRNFTEAELMARGEQVYRNRCAACHGIEGKGIGRVFPPLAGSPVVRGPERDLIDIVKKGKKGTAMMGFSYMGNADLSAVLTYVRKAFGNHQEKIIVKE